MLVGAAEAGAHRPGRQAIFETLTSIKRAGADLILTYFAAEVAETHRRLCGQMSGARSEARALFGPASR